MFNIQLCSVNYHTVNCFYIAFQKPCLRMLSIALMFDTSLKVLKNAWQMWVPYKFITLMHAQIYVGATKVTSIDASNYVPLEAALNNVQDVG